MAATSPYVHLLFSVPSSPVLTLHFFLLPVHRMSSSSTDSDLQQVDPPHLGHGNGQKDSDKKLGWQCTEKLGCVLVYRGK